MPRTTTEMMIGIGIFVGIMGLSFLCWLLFGLYVYAPSVIVGGIAILTFVAGRTAIKTARSPVVRIAITLIFVVPAAWAGYSVTLELAQLFDMHSAVWQHAFALIGAVMVGGALLKHLTDPNPTDFLAMMGWR
jgi:hypothetical protein